MIRKDSEFCCCETEIRTVVLIPAPDGGRQTLGGEPFDEEKEHPEFCDNCGKRNAEPFRFTFTINPKVELTGEA